MLQDLFSGSRHVRKCGLRAVGYAEIREFAKNIGLIIVTKDSDLQERSVLPGGSVKDPMVADEKLRFGRDCFASPC